MESQHSNNILEDAINLAKEDLRKLFLETCGDFNEIVTSLQSRQYSENKVSYFISNLTKRKSELLLLALLHFNSTYGETVQDFDWTLKLIMGTSELKTLKYPLLQMLLFTITKSGSKNKKVYDIGKDMLDKMITVFEEAIET